MACETEIPDRGKAGLVKWGSQDVGGSGSIVVPLVTKDVEYVRGYNDGTDRWIEKEIWTLNGELVNCEGYEELLSAQEALYKIFELDFQSLHVGDLKELDSGIVVSIDIGESDYRAIVPYSVVIEGYRNIQDSETKKVVDATATYVWETSDDGQLTLSYDVSARGINTAIDAASAPNGLDNAKEFVHVYLESKGAIDADGEPLFEYGDFSPSIASLGSNVEGVRHLVSNQVSIDRVTETYGVSMVYSYDTSDDGASGSGKGTLRYTSEVSSPYGEDEVTTINGSIELGYYPISESKPNIELLRDRYYAFRQDQLLIKPGSDDLFSVDNISQETIEEDPLAGTLTFTVIFELNALDCKDDYEVSVSENAQNSILTASIKGTVTYKGPCGWEKLAECFYGKSSFSGYNAVRGEELQEKFYNRTNSGYQGFKSKGQWDIPTDTPSQPIILNTIPLDVSVTEDPQNNSISYSASYDDRISHGYYKLDTTVNIVPPIQQIVSNSFAFICSTDDVDDCPTEDLSHHYLDLGFHTRGKIGVKIDAHRCSLLFTPAPCEDGEGANGEGDFNSEEQAEIWRDEFTPENNQPFLTKRERTSTNYISTEGSEYEWLWVGADAANSDADNRQNVITLYYGE